MTPIFSTHYSLSKSILTLEDEEVIKENAPVSVFAICKQHSLKELYLVESSMSGFIRAYELSKKHNIQLKFGYKTVICNDLNDKSEESLKTESKVIIWALNSDGYKNLIKIHNQATIRGFYYVPRIDFKFLNENITPNLAVSIPFYSSFLHKNLLFGHSCVPFFDKFEPVFHVENHDLPFDNLIKDAIMEYTENGNKYKTWETYQVYCYKPEHSKFLLAFRVINNRSTFEKPQLDHHASSSFAYLNEN